MRLLLLLAAAAFGPALAGCYDQPVIPRDKPLACVATVTTPCPAGFSCIAGFCAPRSCQTQSDCPIGLTCLPGNRGCGLASVDGGAAPQDGGADGSLLDNVVGADR